MCVYLFLNALNDTAVNINFVVDLTTNCCCMIRSICHVDLFAREIRRTRLARCGLYSPAAAAAAAASTRIARNGDRTSHANGASQAVMRAKGSAEGEEEVEEQQQDIIEKFFG